MNRASAFGNLEKAGDKRIAKRRKTIEKKKLNHHQIQMEFHKNL